MYVASVSSKILQHFEVDSQQSVPYTYRFEETIEQTKNPTNIQLYLTCNYYNTKIPREN